jgi:hypothetical protein
VEICEKSRNEGNEGYSVINGCCNSIKIDSGLTQIELSE